MTRAAISLLSLALVVVVTGATRKSQVEASPLPARHSVLAAGTIARVLEAAVSTTPVPDVESERAVTRRRVKAEAVGTYISDILSERDSSIARWPDRAGEPLTVWIQPRSSVADFGSEYVARVRDAFQEWDHLNLPVHFAFVADSAEAEVHVSWIDHFTQPISGRTRWSRDDDWMITDANIVLALHHNNGETLDPESMHAMSLHEIGHLLGLDHTQDTLSVMAPRVRVRALSDADRATVRLVYSLPSGSLR
jgi:hypothetical protein